MRVAFLRQYFRRFLVAALAMIMVMWPGCTSAVLSPDSNYPAIHAKVVVDPSFVIGAQYKQNVHQLITSAATVVRSWCEVSLILDTIQILDFEPDIRCPRLYENDCIVTQIPKDGSDIVIFFSKKTHRYRFAQAGLSYPELGYVFVHQMGWYDATEPFKWSFLTLIHELGHLFGAVHVSPKKNVAYVMEPSMRDIEISRWGMGYHFPDPEFDRANARIILAGAQRPFRDSTLPDSCWTALKGAYDRGHEQFDDWRLDQRGYFSEFTGSHLQILDRYYFLSLFASMAGHTPEALAYADSQLTLARTIEHRGCNAVRYLRGSYGRHWKLVVEALNHYQRARIYLRSGDLRKAEEEKETFVREAERAEFGPENIRKYEAFFDWLMKTRAPRQEG